MVYTGYMFIWFIWYILGICLYGLYGIYWVYVYMVYMVYTGCDTVMVVLDHEPRAKYMVIGTIMRH